MCQCQEIQDAGYKNAQISYQQLKLVTNIFHLEHLSPTLIEPFFVPEVKIKRYDKSDNGNHYSPLLDQIVLLEFYF